MLQEELQRQVLEGARTVPWDDLARINGSLQHRLDIVWTVTQMDLEWHT